MTKRSTKPGLKQVAALAGVGYATASRALSGRGYVAAATKEKVHAAAKELGYTPNLLAKALREDRTNLVGVILPNLVNEFYSDATEVIQDGLARAGFRMLVIAADDAQSQEQAVAELVEHKVAGIIQVPVHGAKASAAGNVPVVQLNRDEIAGAPAVLCDDARGFEELAGIVARRFQEPDVVAVMGDKDLSTTRARLAGIETKFPQVRRVHGEYTAASGRKLCAQLLDAEDPPRALIVSSPRLMAGVLAEIRARGLSVPGDLSVVGYDDPEWYGFFASGITTFSPDHQEMGRKVVRMLLDRVRGEESAALHGSSVGDTARSSGPGQGVGDRRVELVPGHVIRRASHES
ncbi:LacI family DNA-binding transcriptional regulator [Corynebacterium atypicum]|uniref:LacI family DNA-binding transcriptional regulator n=1 Tax=Corynebacterium atypicum TaxID=191610 RepID=UPI00068C2C85|nr:LacI family DNA-binding transcriptional regulator [Corynebacterium atypicum]